MHWDTEELYPSGFRFALPGLALLLLGLAGCNSARPPIRSGKGDRPVVRT